MTNQAYQGLHGKIYTAGRRIGQGGEGAVFEIQEDISLVVKIYSESLDNDKTNKLIFMTSLIDEELVKFAAWPMDIAKDKITGRICGFIMRKLEAYVPLHNLFSPMDRKKLFPDKGYNFLVHVARNLAIAFHKIHQRGIVAGDVNEANILVNSTGLVSLIDCDSFQIKDGQRYHFCEVGIPRYTPPELLLRGSFNNVVRTTNTDAFSLATLIFQLLFLGRAPFTGINPTSQEIDEETAIKTHEFAYSLTKINKRLLPAKNSLDLNTMTSGMITLFHAAFEGTEERPTAAQWANELALFNKEIIQCPKAKIHYFPKILSSCPWCLFKEKANIVYFLDDSYLKSIPELNNIGQFVNGFKVEKIELKTLRQNFTRAGIVAAPIKRKFHTLKNLNTIIIILLSIITLTLCIKLNWGILIFGTISIMIFNSESPSSSLLKKELSIRQNAFNQLEASFKSLIKHYNNLPDLNNYNQSANKLTRLISSFRQLPTEFNTNKKRIEENHYRKKYTLYLQQFDIRNYQISSFGASKKLSLYNNGIRTAADISKLNNIKIAGIGPKNIQILFDWQRQIGIDFTYIPDNQIIEYEIFNMGNVISSKRQKLESDIKNEYHSLNILKANVLSSSSTLQRQYEDLSVKLYQAQLDLEAFKKIKGIL